MPGIASLLPSATEWVYALGAEADLAAVTFECDHPAEARTRHPVVVGGLDTAGRGPAEIDALVRERVAAGADLYTLDTAAMTRLAPDVVLTQDLCRVCALPADAVEAALAAAGGPGRVVTLDPHRLADVLAAAETVGAACGRAEAGRRLRAELAGRLERIETTVAGRSRPRVLVLEWTDPPFVAGHWVPDLVAAAGGTPVLARPGGRSVETDWASVTGVQADVVLVAPCGFDLDTAAEQTRTVLDRLPAGAAVWALDAGGYVTRPGPRVVDGVAAIAAVLHPDAGVPAPVSRPVEELCRPIRTTA